MVEHGEFICVAIAIGRFSIVALKFENISKKYMLVAWNYTKIRTNTTRPYFCTMKRLSLQKKAIIFE